MKKTTLLAFVITILYSQLYSQNGAEELFSVFVDNSLTSKNSGTFTFTDTFSNSGSHWEIDWSETEVFSKLLKYNDSDNINESFELRLGKGGQVYSFKGSFGEALPPQWRNSFDSNGNAISDSNPSIVNGKIIPERGNWAPWVDEVWQMVNTDANDKDIVQENGQSVEKIVTRNIHQAGSYLNNYAHRSSDLVKPFYSPIVSSFYDASTQEYNMIVWAQSESPNYVYDGRSDCNSCHPNTFRANSLYYLKYKNIGDGIIQVDFLTTNFSKVRETNFFNILFLGIRNSNLKYLFFSNPDNTFYEETIPEFSTGATKRSSLTNGWFALSNSINGSTSSLGFVFDSSTIGYSDFRYGHALGPNNIRDANIFSYRLLKANNDHWTLINTKTVRGRYFIVVDANIQNIANKIATNNLTNNAKTVQKDFLESEAQTIYYNIKNEGTNGFTFQKSNQQESNISVKSIPFLNSFPVFLINTNNGDARLTSNPYHYSLRPYDGVVTSMDLLGFSATEVNQNPATLSSKSENKLNFNIYPNPSKNYIYIASEEVIDSKDLTLYNFIGKKIKVPTSIDGNKIRLDISRLSKGVYITKINNTYKKILKN